MRAWEAKDPMTDLVVKLQEDIAAWQEASGLVNEHGDPDGVEPRHLSKHVASLTARVQELEWSRNKAFERVEEQSSRIEELEKLLDRIDLDATTGVLVSDDDSSAREAFLRIRDRCSRALQRDATEGGRSDG